METLLGRLQMADSSNQYNPYQVGEPIMDQPCTILSNGSCVSSINHRAGAPMRYIPNPPPEFGEYLQREPDEDVVARGSAPRRKEPIYRDTIGTNGSDMSRGQMMLASAGDMPIVRKFVLLDTRARDPAVQPNPADMTFYLDEPIQSVTRIAVQYARVPIFINALNPGLAMHDYVMMSIGLNIPDVVIPNQQRSVLVTPPNVFGRALAYLTLTSPIAGVNFAGIASDTPPYRFYTDFMKPIGSIDRIHLSWWMPANGTAPVPAPYTFSVLPGGIGTVSENAIVGLVFYCKNRRPE